MLGALWRVPCTGGSSVRRTLMYCTRTTWSTNTTKALIHLKNGSYLIHPVRHASIKSGLSGGKVAKKSEIFRLLSLAEPEKYRLAGAIGLLVISSGVTMAVPFALGKIIDLIYSMDQIKNSETVEQKARISERLNTVCMGLSVVFVVGAACNFGRVYLMRVAGQNITANLRNKVYSSIVRQEVGFFDKSKTGELINRLSADSQLVSQTVTAQVSDGMRAGFMTLAGVGMMFYMSPQLACVGLGIVPPVALWAVWMGKKVRGVSKEVQDSLAGAAELADEKISNIRTVRMFGKEEKEIAAYNAKMNNVLSISTREALIQAKFFGMTGLSGNMIILTVLYYGGSLVTTDVITVGSLASFILYSAYVGIGLSGVSTFYAEMMKGLGASSRLWDLVDRTPQIPTTGGIVPSSNHLGDIVFSDVHFSYPSRPDHKILQGLDLHIPSNSILAVVGTSGSGKSTIASLLLRLYEPEEGRVQLGDNDVRTIDPSWLRRYIGTVAQEPVLFSSSIRENILYGVHNPDLVTPDQLQEAAKEANAHNFILGFPDGYDTLVGERGVMLSGGQKQRIAIARAIIKNPAILLLDEATSALDAQSEHEVKVALDRIMKGRSVITIAHRLSTIKNADLIAVIDSGKVVEFGEFNQLMAKEGRFRSLVDQQLRGLQ